MNTFAYTIRMLILLAVAPVLFTGCLVAEKQEYIYRVNEDGSGSGTIRYINLVSQDNTENEDNSFDDFSELLDYIEGTQLEQDSPYLSITEKKLYEENGVLVGEFSFTFTAWDSVGFLHTTGCECCPTFYHFENTSSETYESSNGEYIGGSGMFPFVRYPAGTREFRLTTKTLDDLSGTHPLIDDYRGWKK